MNKRDWEVHPPLIYPDYKSTILRGPKNPLVTIDEHLMQANLPVYGEDVIGEIDNDLTKNGITNGNPVGERIAIRGKVMDELGRGIPNTLIEIWQANSAGRYVHKVDRHNAPLDPNFFGAGRTLTDTNGNYTFYTIKPGAYPWGNHHNAWRPNHIHFSLFGTHLESRLVTQMYFPGDPLFEFDPIFNSIPKEARKLLVADFKLEHTEPEFALGYEFNIVLRGRNSTPIED
ncbi:MAG: protocatechuate 3,4-dioxygenase subunit beta [Allomuricauda sp.]|nr:MAG: protocatechuate 3,4-dioxygenase subunit beta [Allomuricauda sp.]